MGGSPGLVPDVNAGAVTAGTFEDAAVECWTTDAASPAVPELARAGSEDAVGASSGEMPTLGTAGPPSPPKSNCSWTPLPPMVKVAK